MNTKDKITIKGARVHNLKNISVTIPKNKLVVFTGLSGSGKSSLAFDTIFAEGQRRYIESLSSYARQFLGIMQKPDVESITGLSPAIAIDQKTVSHNPRSTVGTTTEVYDYLRLLFARIGHSHCPSCGREVTSQTPDQIAVNILKKLATPKPPHHKILILAPIIKGQKGEHKAILDDMVKQGYFRFRIDGQVVNLGFETVELDKNKRHIIEVVVDRLVLGAKPETKRRLNEAVEKALRLSGGYLTVAQVLDQVFEFPENPKQLKDHVFSEDAACLICGISLSGLQARNFSFNSPYGACQTCSGLGQVMKVDFDKVFNFNLTFNQGAVLPWFYHIEYPSYQRALVEQKAKEYGFDMDTPISQAPPDLLKDIFENGVVPYLNEKYQRREDAFENDRLMNFFKAHICPACRGTRLKPESLSVTITNLNIAQVSALSIGKLYEWLDGLIDKLESVKEQQVAEPIVKELKKRVGFLSSVGLDYLSLNRSSATLSGGEAQRIRLASQIGSQLSGVLYVLDEPSIGLHPRDHHRLLETLKQLRDLGNTVIVVEHDWETILSADWIVDFGPLAGDKGGRIVAEGPPAKIKANKNSLTGRYLKGKRQVFPEIEYRKLNLDQAVYIHQASKHNLKDIDVLFPLGGFIVVSGVSGSGKSSLVMETLYPALKKKLSGFVSQLDGCQDLTGWEEVDKVVVIDQSPIGRTPRSNPATYTKAFDPIRQLFALLPEAQKRGYKPGRFSFNVKGGRCEYCKGEGQIKISMQFLSDVYVTCDKCQGSRYHEETLKITYKNKNIAEVLDMTVDQAYAFFKRIPQIERKLKTLQQVGLGYIKLGQPATTLSGGEAQRIKLSAELAKKATGKTVYILDEPTTGLHFADIDKLLHVLHHLVDQGNTVIVIEHNLDVVKTADWLIDLGPEGGQAGGQIIFAGPIRNLLRNKASYTAQFLRQHT